VLRQVAEGVLIQQSEFCQSNAVVVQGRAGVLLIDPGVQGHEMAALADDLRELGQPVVAGFSTHPHWDHLRWHPRLGEAPRYGTAPMTPMTRGSAHRPRTAGTGWPACTQGNSSVSRKEASATGRPASRSMRWG
jgi:glyoxylase-like metal-dependent hydrolase (beta-lactamase superfamily II)